MCGWGRSGRAWGAWAADLALRPFWTFLKLYLGKQGFRDGLEGFVFCALSGLSVAELAQAVTLQESGRLTKIPGIGKKTAERLLLELKDKLGGNLTQAVGINKAPPPSSDILNALLSLGYSDKEAVAAVKELPEGIAVADGIKQALKRLAKA